MSSASIGSGSHLKDASSIRAWYQWSRPAFIDAGIEPAPRCTTMTFSIDGVSCSASSATCFSATICPRR